MTYEIQGNDMPVVVCRLNAGESMITERGSMAWMSPNMNMKTSSGGLGKALGRLLSSESLFRNIYTAENGPGMIAFASSFPGSILALEVTPEKPIIAQKSAFLASTEGVELSVFLHHLVYAVPDDRAPGIQLYLFCLLIHISAVSAFAARCQRKQHESRQYHCDDPLHIVFSFMTNKAAKAVIS